MISVRSEVTVAANADAVWDKLIDCSRWEDWFPLHAGWPDGTPPELRNGSRFRQRLSHTGIADTVEVTVDQCVPRDRLLLVAQGNHGADARTTMQLVQQPDGRTRISVEIEIVGKLTRPLSTLVKAGLQRNLRQRLPVMAVEFEHTSPSSVRHQRQTASKTLD